MIKISYLLPIHIPAGRNENIDLTRSAFYSFRQATPEGMEIVVVDDASKIGGGYLKSEADKILVHSENKGFLHSVNEGLGMVAGELIAVCNNDIRVAPNFYEVAKEILDDPKVYSVHPKMIPYDEPFSHGDLIAKTGKERWCQTSFFIIRGDNPKPFLFDKNFLGTGGAYEDWGYWASVREAGYQTAYTNRTSFQHKDSSTTQFLGEQNKLTTENREYFKSKHGEYPEDLYSRLYPDQMKVSWKPFP